MRRFEAVISRAEDAKLLARVKAAVYQVVPDAVVILYGSRARGDARPDSDYDLLVLAEAPATASLEEEVRKALYPIELETGAVLTLLLYSKTDWLSAQYRAMPFHEHVDRDGIQL